MPSPLASSFGCDLSSAPSISISTPTLSVRLQLTSIPPLHPTRTPQNLSLMRNRVAASHVAVGALSRFKALSTLTLGGNPIRYVISVPSRLLLSPPLRHTGLGCAIDLCGAIGAHHNTLSPCCLDVCDTWHASTSGVLYFHLVSWAAPSVETLDGRPFVHPGQVIRCIPGGVSRRLQRWYL